MDNLIKQKYLADNKYNVLFLPGLPGEYRDRPMIDELYKMASNIYSVIYPGTYGYPGVLSPESTISCIKSSIKKLEKKGLPILVISYSFSTLFILEAAAQSKNLMGIILFSPIFDLSNTITSDFTDTCRWLNSNDGFNVDTDSFNRLTSLEYNYNNFYAKSMLRAKLLRTPVVYIIGDEDSVIRHDVVDHMMESHDNSRPNHTAFIYHVKNGEHKLDTLYESGIVQRIVKAIYFSRLVADRYPESTIYAWGATLNYLYSREDTDVDLAIIGNNFANKDYVYLNELVNKFNKDNSIEVDIIVNTFSELMTKNKIRSNRGPSFIHELNYYYIPVKYGKEFNTSKITKRDIIRDARYANDTNIYKSKKALLNYIPGTSASNWIMKDFLIGCFYDQYSKGNIYVDQNRIEKYYELTNREIYDILIDIKKIKNDGYKNVNLQFLEKVVEVHEKIKI